MRWAYFGPETPREELANELLFDRTHAMLSCDIETVSLENTQIIGIGLCDEHDNAFYFPTYPEPSPYLHDVLKLLNNPRIVKLFHNGLFDIPSLMDQYGVEIAAESIMDTLIMAQLAGYTTKLTGLALECGTQSWSWDMKALLSKHKAKTTLELPNDVLVQKCCLDVQATFTAYKHLEPLIDMSYVREEMKLIPIIIQMQKRGLVIDHEMRVSIGNALQKDIDFYRSICRDEGFNPASYKQVGYMLAKRGNHQVIGRRNGKMKYQTGDEILNKLGDPLAAVVLNYRRTAKEKSTYIDPLEKLSKLTTHFSFETATRRLASAKFNLQNWPKHLRKVVKGPITCFDFSQQELRTLAYMSGDRVMQGVFDRGEDIHAATAGFVYKIPLSQVTPEIRRPCKNTNFCLIYGGGAQAIAETAGIQDIRVAEELRRTILHTYKQVAEWMEDIRQFAVDHGKVPTIGGAWLHIKDEYDKEGIGRKAVNYSIQGSAAELTKKAMIRCAHLPMLLQIHDELAFENDVRDELQKLDLAHVGPFVTPIDLKMMERWE